MMNLIAELEVAKQCFHAYASSGASVVVGMANRIYVHNIVQESLPGMVTVNNVKLIKNPVIEVRDFK